ncbi:hypothetical protein HanIR_Chr10g0472261 [Helianthus annuus]|nr:hypothetical protein HanIR_Chr10g0472261 [Helianthus annuus]
MDHQSDVEETNDVDSDSDYVVSDESSDDGDDVDFDAVVSDYEVDPDVYPIEFRLNVKVASLSRIHRSLKMTVENLNGIDTVIDFRREKHGKGFKYAACQWTKKFTKPNGIYRNMKCKFVYSTEKSQADLKESLQIVMVVDITSCEMKLWDGDVSNLYIFQTYEYLNYNHICLSCLLY